MLTLPVSDPRVAALTKAIQTGDTPALERLLREDPAIAKTTIVDNRNVERSLMHLTTEWPGHWPRVAASIVAIAAAGGEVDAQAVVGGSHPSAETPLHGAASSDDVEAIDALLDAGADIEKGGAVFTAGPAMSDAVVFGQWKAARRLLERGASTTIWQAAALGLMDRMREHLAKGNVSPRDITNALWHACRGGALETAQLLVELGGDAAWVGHDRKTPTDVARESGNQELVRWLEERAAMRSGRGG